MADFRPRPDDELVEPLFGGLGVRAEEPGGDIPGRVVKGRRWLPFLLAAALIAVGLAAWAWLGE